MSHKHHNKLRVLIIVLVTVSMILATFLIIPIVMSLKDEAGREWFKLYVEDKGFWGVLIILALQVIQVIIAVIPGEPIEVIAGLLYGTFGGYVICTIGMLIGTVAIFYFIRHNGTKFVRNVIGEDKLLRYKFLSNTKRLETIVFILFFIPGTPKDVITYIVPITEIKASIFFVIVTVARIPSIISSTYAGASLSDGEWIKTLVIFVIIGIVGLIGIWGHDKFVNRFGRLRDK